MHPLIPVHILGGSAALIAGFVVLALPKGGRAHVRAGTVFLLGMLVLGGTGSVIALSDAVDRGTAVIGVLTCYLVATAWLTARRRGGEAGWPEWVLLAVALACTAGFLAVAVLGLAEPDGRLDQLPAEVLFAFATIAGLAAALDVNYLLRPGPPANRRLLRHLWRMLAALLIATMSFFQGQQRVMPAFIQGSPLLLLPIFVVMGSLAFWILRVRFAKAWRRGSRAAEAAAA